MAFKSEGPSFFNIVRRWLIKEGGKDVNPGVFTFWVWR